MTLTEDIFTTYYTMEAQFKRHAHTIEAYARRNKYKRVVHKLESGEVLKEVEL